MYICACCCFANVRCAALANEIYVIHDENLFVLFFFAVGLILCLCGLMELLWSAMLEGRGERKRAESMEREVRQNDDGAIFPRT